MKNRGELIKLSDEELMVEFRLASHEAFIILYERYAPRAFGFIKSRVSEDAQAEDILQEVFFKLYRNKDKFDASQPFIPWFFTLCRNTLIDANRTAKRQKEAAQNFTKETENLVNFSSESFQNNDLSTDALHILSSLNTKEREVLTLRYEADLPFNKVAKLTGLSASNVRKIASRAIEKLRGGTRI